MSGEREGGGREGGRKGGREGRREGGREGGRAGGRERERNIVGVGDIATMHLTLNSLSIVWMLDSPAMLAMMSS